MSGDDEPRGGGEPHGGGGPRGGGGPGGPASPAAADGSDGTQARFLSSASHELRTPLNAILGFAQVLKQESGRPLDAQQRLCVEQILANGTRLLGMVDGIMDLMQLEGGLLALDVGPTDLGAVIEECLSFARTGAAEAGLVVDFAVTGTAPPAVLADATRMRQVLAHVLANALRHGSNGGGTVTLDVGTDGSHARLRVIDTGPGFSAAIINHAFEPFTRDDGDAADLSAAPAHGIGLALTRGLIERMGGSAGARNRDEGGAEVWFTLPLA